MDIFFDRRNIYATHTSEIKLLLKIEERREKEKGKGITTRQIKLCLSHPIERKKVA